MSKTETGMQTALRKMRANVVPDTSMCVIAEAFDGLLSACRKALGQYRADISDIGPCDHSVNICVCGLISDAEELSSAIAKAEGRA